VCIYIYIYIYHEFQIKWREFYSVYGSIEKSFPKTIICINSFFFFKEKKKITPKAKKKKIYINSYPNNKETNINLISKKIN